MNNFIIKGDICYSKSDASLICEANSYLIVDKGVCCGVFESIPSEYANFDILDCSGKLIIPGLSDLHVHAPQFAIRGLGMDMELLDWLKNHAFPQESMYCDLEYADRAYSIFVESIKKSFSTRVCVFGTIHAEATAFLAKKLEEAGLCGFVGKVNMDRDCPPALLEKDSLAETEKYKNLCENLENVKPIITPRFVPSCTDETMDKLGKFAVSENLPVQSHLSENLGEIELVKKLCPTSRHYADAYDMHSLFGQTKTVMAHCVYCTDEEIELIKDRGVFVAHCPQSNTNIASGIAPVRKFLNLGVKIGLGSDVAGGSSESMAKAITDAIMVSKLYWRLIDQGSKPLSFADAFYMASRLGGEFFGKVGSFEEGFEADILVISDENKPSSIDLSTIERLERIFYIGNESNIISKFVKGNKIF